METNLDRIKELAEAREDENHRFRTFLKGYSKDIDPNVHHYYHDVSSQIDCTACANCCKQIQPTLDQEDIQHLAQGLNMSSDQVIQDYLIEERHDEENEGWTFREKPCPLLQHNRCTQYAFRPHDCCSYPHLQKSGVVSRLWGVIDNYAICPIVFNVYELLKAALWSHTQAASPLPETERSGIRVYLQALIEGMEGQTEEIHSYLNQTTGQVVTVSDEELYAAEIHVPLDQFPEWQHQFLLIARDIVDTEKYLLLPSKYEIHDYQIMEQFCLSIAHDERRETLSHAIQGRGAFRRFRDTLSQYDLEQEWDTYRKNVLRAMAIAWCTRHGIRYVVD